MGAAARKEVVYTVPEVVGILQSLEGASLIAVLEEIRPKSEGPAFQDPFRRFAYDAETLIRQTRAEVIACNAMLETSSSLEPDVQDAISHLVVACYARLDKLLELHSAAHERARNRRAA